MRTAALIAVSAICGVAAGVGSSLLALPQLDATCLSPETRLHDLVCPPSAVALRNAGLRREALAARLQFPLQGPRPAEPRSTEVQRRLAELDALQRRAAARAPHDPARASELQQINQRLGELRTLPYGGQAAADEAIATMSTVMPELANDPVIRAGLRVGGVALDAGQAIDHAIGPNINRAAERVEGVLTRLRPKP